MIIHRGRSAVAMFVVSLTGCGRISFDPIAIPTDGMDGADSPGSDGEAAGLLLHFAFESDGMLRDRAPGHHDAVCATTCPVSVAGRVGATAVRFSGGACLEVADAPELHPAAFTFAVWYRPEVSGLASAFSRSFHGATAGTNTFEAFIDLSDVWKAAVNTMSINIPLDHGTWHHLVGAFDGSSLAMYIDGTPRGAPRMVGPASYGPDNVTMGCDVNNGAYSNSVTGLVDDVRLYDHALSATEVAQLAAQL